MHLFCDESNDLAVLKIDGEGLTPVILGSSDQMNVGDSVVAIGNPLDELTFSLTSGSVSALNRKVTINNTAMTQWPSGQGQFPFMGGGFPG